MTKAEYETARETVRAGRVAHYRGRTATSLAELDFIAQAAPSGPDTAGLSEIEHQQTGLQNTLSESLSQQGAGTEARVSSLQAQRLEELETENADLRRQVEHGKADAMAECAELEAAVQKAEKRAEALETEKAGAAKTLAALEKERDDLKARLAELAAQVETFRKSEQARSSDAQPKPAATEPQPPTEPEKPASPNTPAPSQKAGK